MKFVIIITIVIAVLAAFATAQPNDGNQGMFAEQRVVGNNGQGGFGFPGNTPQKVWGQNARRQAGFEEQGESE